MTKKAHLWERQKTDTDKSYSAFCVYRDMGRDRSIRGVGRELGKSKALIDRWSSKHDWVNRVNAYDDYLEAQQRNAYETSVTDAKAKHVAGMVKRVSKLYEQWDTAYEHSKLLAVKRTIERDGKTIEITALDTDDQHRFAKWLADIDSLARRQYEMPDRYTHQKQDVEIKDWRSEAVQDIRAGTISYSDLATAFDVDLAQELFKQAGVPIEQST